jgi:16S rRNA (cytosine1402-N4)-methyltransferase
MHARYCEMSHVLEELGISHVGGILLDLGLSSDQLATPDRGFSFSVDGPLDMRFDRSEPGPTAAELVNRLPEAELAKMFFDFGEERYSRRISRRIVAVRRNQPIRTTAELAELVRQSVPGKARHGPIDPATRVFQALRIAVNHELEELDTVLEVIPDVLAPLGRAAIISFHSLEDRRVKWAFKTNQTLRVLTKKPVTATAEEVAENPRARSAKLRVVERCPNPT